MKRYFRGPRRIGGNPALPRRWFVGWRVTQPLALYRFRSTIPLGHYAVVYWDTEKGRAICEAEIEHRATRPDTTNGA